MTIIDYDGLVLLREKYRNKKIVCCTGIFDLTHVGHLLFFEDCKKCGDILVVSVANDSLIKGYKGKNKPILNQSIRLKMIDSLKPVDYTILDKLDKWLGKESHQITLGALFSELKPDYYIVNSDAVDIEERRKIADNFGVKLIVLDRWCPSEFDNISTSKLIEKIKET